MSPEGVAVPVDLEEPEEEESGDDDGGTSLAPCIPDPLDTGWKDGGEEVGKEGIGVEG